MAQTQLDTQDWKDFHRELQECKAKKRAINTTTIYKFCVANSVQCDKFTDYHFRLSREGFVTVDVFPTSSKVHLLLPRERFKKVDIIKFLTKHFQ